MTEPTPLDLAHADIVAANGADAEQRARMAWFLRLLDTQLFVLATDVSDDAPRIAEFALEEGAVALGFDRERRLADFVGREAAFAALPGRVVARQLADAGLGLAVNAGTEGATVLAPADVAWLADLAAQSARAEVARLSGLSRPTGVDPALLRLVGDRLASMGGLVRRAWLAATTRGDGANGLVLAVEAGEDRGAEAMVRSLAELGALAGQQFDVTLVGGDDPHAAVLDRVGLRIDIERADADPPPVPGSDPDRPPRLR